MNQSIKRPKNLTPGALIICARWLSYCLTIGWQQSDLDELESWWWKYHDRLGQLRRTRRGTYSMNQVTPRQEHE